MTKALMGTISVVPYVPSNSEGSGDLGQVIDWPSERHVLSA